MKRLLILLFCILFMIPNISSAQTTYNPDFQNHIEVRQVGKWAAALFNYFLSMQKNVLTIDKPGVYEFGNYKGTIVIYNGNVTLKNTDLSGNLIVLKSANDGEINLENVIIRGSVNIYGNNVKLLLNGKFNNVIVLSSSLNLILNKGNIENLTVRKGYQNTTINLYAETEVNTLLLDSVTYVKGKGVIRKATVTINGVIIEQIPQKLVHENGINVQVGYSRKSGSDNSNSNNNQIDIEIVSEVMKDLKLELKGAVGRKASPKIILPSTDDKGYQSNITWVSDNLEFTQIEGNEATIYRRGVNGSHSEDHDDGGCENDVNSSASVSLVSMDGTNFESLSHDERSEGCSGSGGKVNLVRLSATVNKGIASDTKTFYVFIPWGWGKAISIAENNSESGEHEHSDSAPIPKVIPDQNLFIGQYPLYISPEDLAQNGEIITNVEYEVVSTTTASAITGSAIAAVNIVDNSLLRIEPYNPGSLIVTADVENSAGKANVTFKVLIETRIQVDDLSAVNDSSKNLRLNIISKGHDSSQKNSIILPDTDYLGYGTSITWASKNNDFLMINGDIDLALINRRGSSKVEGGCGEHTELEALSIIASGEEEKSDEESCDGSCEGDDDSDEEGSCSGDEDGYEDSSQGGKSTNVELIATIKRGEAEITKNIFIKIPWGWGKTITVKY
ncbi:MAG: hypothetical protein K0Q47_292 [Sedimentibacter sp.]|jgi:hypothetical protein|nr:hypothetical protein [Sedimentibacter sp.]